MTTHKHEIEESLRDDRVACSFCNENEADSICDRCSQPVCIACTDTSPEFGVLCPDCREALK